MSRTDWIQTGRKAVWVYIALLLCCSLVSSISFLPSANAEPPAQSSFVSRGHIVYSFSHSSQNLAAIPMGWGDYDGVEVHFGTGPQIIHVEVDPAHFHNGNVSIRLDPHEEGVDGNHAREADTGWLPVKPGDRVVFRCWIKTSSAANPINNGDLSHGGARIGIDLYGSDSIVYSHPLEGNEDVAIRVPFGSDWTLKTWDFVIPDTYFDTNWNWGSPDYGIPGSISPQQACGIIAWMQVIPVTEGIAWFADAELYINP